MKLSLAVRYPDGRSTVRDSVMIQGRKYIPPWPDSLITKKVVLFPSKLVELRSEPELLELIRIHLNRYFDFGSDKFYERLCAYYVMFTWVYDGFNTVPYLRALGDYGTGKSRLLDTVGSVCYRPIRITGASSASSIFRTLDLYHGTLILDEADFAKSDEATIIAKILNAGNQKGRPLLRTMDAGNGRFKAEAYDVFGPKIIATRKGFDDRAIESRCLTKEMGGGMPHPRIPIELPPAFWVQAQEIRNMLLAYRMATAEPERQVDYSMVDRSIEPRLTQVTLGLMTTVHDEALREDIMGFIRDVNEQLRTDRSMTMTARVLEGLVRCYAWGPVSDRPEDEERIYLKDLAKATNMVVDEQNRLMGDEMDDDEDDGLTKKRRKGRMTSRRVGDVVRKYLQLETRRATDGIPGYKGTNYVIWDEERVRALCARWGVEWLERGAMKRPVPLEKVLQAEQGSLLEKNTADGEEGEEL